MKKHAIQILLVAVFLVVGVFFHFYPSMLRQDAEVEVAPFKVIEEVVEKEKLHPVKSLSPPLVAQRPALASIPVPMSVPVPSSPPPQIAPPQAIKSPPQKRIANQLHATQYWQQVAQRFEGRERQLDREKDPDKRMDLIRSMAQNVRSDTPRTLEWAMGLENPDERRAALDAINQNALVGIGARIRMDETGLPKIVDTMVLSAVASTGMTQQGDYISGMVESDGTVVDFKDRPIREIVRFLRGQPGTEIRLLMERASFDGKEAPYSFDVPVRRSMIIVQPPF